MHNMFFDSICKTYFHIFDRNTWKKILYFINNIHNIAVLGSAYDFLQYGLNSISLNIVHE